MDGIENAKIVRTSLGVEDHGIMTAYLHMEFACGGQAFGGYALDQYNKTCKSRHGSDFGMEFVKQVLSVLEVTDWEKLPGTFCRIERENGLIVRIGHFMKENWFDPKILADSYKSAA